MVAPSSTTIKPAIAAGVLLLAIDVAHAADADLPSDVSQVLELTKVSRSQAYEMRSRLAAALQTLHQPAGRPAAGAPAQDDVRNVLVAVRDFVVEHPGCVGARGKHRTWSDEFRRFVIEMLAPGAPASKLTHEQAAGAFGVPLGTLKDWLRSPAVNESDSVGAASESPDAAPVLHCSQPQIATLLSEFQSWQGNLSAFCEYATVELALPFGRGFITSVLVAAGLHAPKPRKAPHQPPWSRGSMRAGFPGMQWFGDGKQLRVVFAGHSLLFNIEAMVDGASNAAVAARVTEVEDAAAVVEAFNEGLETVGGVPPLATTLDNRPSNFSPPIDQALSSTQVLRATPGRGQSKAPVEGAFGLFEQSLPGTLVIEGDTVRDAAKAIAQAVVHAFFAGRNGKPRGKLGGKSPAQAYGQSQPTTEQVQEALRWILKLREREEIARRSREGRADPIRRKLIREALAELSIDDPQGEASLSLCGYSLGAIIRGIAIFRSKAQMGTLPKDCDRFRYLAGIIRNTDSADALERTAVHLLQLRMRAGDLQRAPLAAKADPIRNSASAPDAVREFVVNALAAPSTLEFRFWNAEARVMMASLHEDVAIPLFHTLTRLIAATFKTDRKPETGSSRPSPRPLRPSPRETSCRGPIALPHCPRDHNLNDD